MRSGYVQQLELLVAAASSWAALVWKRPEDELPKRRGPRLLGLYGRDLVLVVCWPDGAWTLAPGANPTLAPDLYLDPGPLLDGSLPTIPEATDEG